MADIRQQSAIDILQNYRRWKEEGESLKSQAQGFLVERFLVLVQEAQQVQHDLFEDFGHVVKFPANPKFVKKAKGRPVAKKAALAARALGQTAAELLPAPPAKAPSLPARAPSLPAKAPAAPAKQSAAQKASGSGASLRLAEPEPVSSGRAKVSRAGGQGTASVRRQQPVAPVAKRAATRTVAQLTRQVEKARQRLVEAQASGSPVKVQNAEDRLYELSDELRLLTRESQG